MKKTFTFFSILVSTISFIQADNLVVTHRAKNGQEFKQTMNCSDDVSSTIRKVKAPVMMKDDEETDVLTVHVKYVYPDNLVPEYVAYDENSFGSSLWYEGDDEVDFEIDKEWIYDGDNILVASFIPVDKTLESHPDNRYYVFVDVPELKDGMEVVFDANTIDRTFDIRFLNRDGNPIVMKHHRYNTETKESYYDGDGDYESATGEIYIGGGHVMKKTGQLFFLTNRSYSDGRPDRVQMVPPTVKTNKLPDGLVVNAFVIARNDSDDDFAIIATPSVTTGGVISNDISDYIDEKLRITGTPDGMVQESLWLNAIVSNNGWMNNSLGFSPDKYGTDDNGVITINYTSCIPVATMQGNDLIQILTGVKLNDAVNSGDIFSTVFMPDKNERSLEYLLANTTFGGYNDADNNMYFRNFTDWNNPSIFTRANSFIPSSLSAHPGIIANNCPAIVSLGMWPEGFGKVPTEYAGMLIDMGYLSFGYNGRNGEAFTVDSYMAEVNSETDGNCVKYTVVNDNVTVDNSISGFNNAKLGCMMDNEDWVPPTLQTLYFTDKTGTVTDRFATPGDVTMTLYAGDFKYTYNDAMTEDMMAVDGIADITVEYAPYGSDAFRPIEVKENPEKFFMPGFGYCFEASLEAVDRKSANGWFDLHIRLTDANGNYQTQTISPAFKVESLAGLEKPVTESFGGEVEYYSLQGMRIKQPVVGTVVIRRCNGVSTKTIAR